MALERPGVVTHASVQNPASLDTLVSSIVSSLPPSESVSAKLGNDNDSEPFEHQRPNLTLDTECMLFDAPPVVRDLSLISYQQLTDIHRNGSRTRNKSKLQRQRHRVMIYQLNWSNFKSRMRQNPRNLWFRSRSRLLSPYRRLHRHRVSVFSNFYAVKI